MDKKFNARIQHKIDTQENWEKAVNFIPLKGEWIFYDKDAENADIRLKIGDGETNVNELPFVSTSESGNSQSVQSDYEQNDAIAVDYIKNRPFYDTRECTYYSQADTPNPVSFDNAMMNYSFYKISDLVPTREQIFGEMKIINQVGSNIAPIEDNIVIETNEFIATNDGSWGFCFINTTGTLSFTYSGYPMTIEVPEVGIYYIRPIGAGVPEGRTFEINLGGELKALDKKYLPKGMAYGYESKPFEDITWDGNTEGLLSTSADVDMGSDGVVTFYAYKVSDKVLSKTNIIGAEATLIYEDGSEDTHSDISSDELIDVNSNGSFINNNTSFFVITEDNTTADLSAMVPGLTVDFPESGIWFLKPEMSGTVMFCTKSLIARTDIIKIDSKYLPIGKTNGVAGLDGNGKIPQNQINTVFGVQQYNYNPITSGAVYIALGNRSQLNFDSSPMSGSQNPVTSDGVYWAIENKNITVDDSVIYASSNPVSGGAVYTALGNRSSIETDATPINDSTNFMTSGSIYRALSFKQDNLTFDSTPISGSSNPVKSGGVYTALQDIQSKIPSIEGLAEKTYVDTSIANIIDTAPETLNTLNELAAALGDDPNFATTIANQIGTKANMIDVNGALDTKQNITNLTTTIDANSTDTQYPSAKAVYDLIGDCNTVIDSINALVGGESV